MCRVRDSCIPQRWCPSQIRRMRPYLQAPAPATLLRSQLRNQECGAVLVSVRRSMLPDSNGRLSAFPTWNETFDEPPLVRRRASAIIVSLRSTPAALPGATRGPSNRRKSPVPHPTSRTRCPGRTSSGAKNSVGELLARSISAARVASRSCTKNPGSSVLSTLIHASAKAVDGIRASVMK